MTGAEPTSKRSLEDETLWRRRRRTLEATSRPAPAAASAAGERVELDLDAWDTVVAAARGHTVNWYMYGGSESINRFVDTFCGEALRERYGITLNRVPIGEVADLSVPVKIL